MDIIGSRDHHASLEGKDLSLFLTYGFRLSTEPTHGQARELFPTPWLLR